MLRAFLFASLAVAAPAYFPPPGGAGSAPTAADLPGATILSPAALAADTNDWAPGTLTAFSVVRADPDANVAVTGIAGGASGDRLQVCNIDTAFRLRLANQSASSTAANRITSQDAAGVSIQPGACADLVYDGTSSRWRAPVTSPEVTLVLAADFSEDANTVTDVTGMACPTVSGASYLVFVNGDYDTAAITTGLQWTINNAGGSGSFFAQAPASAVSMSSRIDQIAAGTLAAGTNGPNTTGNAFGGFALVTGTGNDIKLRIRTEVAASAVTLKAGRVVMTCRRVA